MKLLQFEILSIGHRYSLVVVRGEDYFPCDKRVLKGRGKWGGGRMYRQLYVSACFSSRDEYSWYRAVFTHSLTWDIYT